MPTINVPFTDEEFKYIQHYKRKGQSWKEYILEGIDARVHAPEEISKFAEMHATKALSLFQDIATLQKNRTEESKIPWDEKELELHQIALGEIAEVIRYNKKHPDALRRLKELSKTYGEAANSIDKRWAKDADNKDFTPEEEYKLALGMAAFWAWSELSPY